MRKTETVFIILTKVPVRFCKISCDRLLPRVLRVFLLCCSRVYSEHGEKDKEIQLVYIVFLFVFFVITPLMWELLMLSS